MDLSKKKEYPTFARTTTLNSDVIYMILQLMKKYDWNKFAIMYEKSHIWGSVHDALKNEVAKSATGLEITLTESYVKTDSYKYKHESLTHIFIPFMDKLPGKARGMLKFDQVLSNFCCRFCVYCSIYVCIYCSIFNLFICINFSFSCSATNGVSLFLCCFIVFWADKIYIWKLFFWLYY